MVDKCPELWAGGNGYFTAGAHRTAHEGLADLLPLLAHGSPSVQLTPAQIAAVNVGPYPAAAFAADIQRLGAGRSDPALVGSLVERSRDAVGWLADRVRVPFVLSFNRQAYEVDGRMQFWGGMALSVEDGGKGLIKAHRKALKEAGVDVWFEARAVEILTMDRIHEKDKEHQSTETGKEVCGIAVEMGGQIVKLATPSVVLAAGGFEASREMRMKYLGEAWENARVSWSRRT